MGGGRSVGLGLLVLALLPAVAPQTPINVMHITDSRNPVARSAWQVVLKYIQGNAALGITLGQVTEVVNSQNDSVEFTNATCQSIDAAIAGGKPPHLVVDTTLAGVASEIVKGVTRALAIPTISASYGHENDLLEWRKASDRELQYLVQVMPPGDIMTEVIRDIVKNQNITSAAVLYDDTFVMEHRYKSLLVNLPTRHMIRRIPDTDAALRAQLKTVDDADVNTFFVVGSSDTIRRALSEALNYNLFGSKYAWFGLTKDTKDLQCGSCVNTTIVYMTPQPSDAAKQSRMQTLNAVYGLTAAPQVDAAFYFDVALRAIAAVKQLMSQGLFPANYQLTTCAAYDSQNPSNRTLNLRSSFGSVPNLEDSYGPLVLNGNGKSYYKLDLNLNGIYIRSGQVKDKRSLGRWSAGLPGAFFFEKGADLQTYRAVTYYKVTTVVQPPFIIKKQVDGQTKFDGYCIDLINEIRKIVPFEYSIYEAPDGKFGAMDDNNQWNGMIQQLIIKNATIALAPLSVMAERENVVDFTVPYYDLVGITILMKKPKIPTSLFKFLTVLETDVWLCILAAYFFTSILLWIFDRFSPYSYQNNREKYRDDEEKRDFDLKESLWFCMTSLTPQGGGEAPKNLSGRLVAATWWLFGFIIIASYTANLAAFLTVSRLDTPIESLDDLAKQYKVRYAPMQDTSTATYFQRMAYIEQKFYEIWKDMSLNDSLSEVERAKLAVWDYPVSDKYTKLWLSMQETILPKTFTEALQKVRDSPSSTEGFAYLGDATDIRYQEMTNCDLQMVGDEFSRKPYAIAVQQGSPLKEQFNDAILKLLNQRKLESLKEKWWNQNPEKKNCDDSDDQSDGISIYNIGGVFIVIFVGIVLACLTLAFEYYYYKHRVPNQAAMAGKPGITAVKEYDSKARGFGTDFDTRHAW